MFFFIIQEHEYAPNAYEYEMMPYEYEITLIPTFNLYYIYRYLCPINMQHTQAIQNLLHASSPPLAKTSVRVEREREREKERV
jgi:hypothetical protein